MVVLDAIVTFVACLVLLVIGMSLTSDRKEEVGALAVLFAAICCSFQGAALAGAAVIAEGVLTFVLAGVILTACIAASVEDRSYAPALIGSTIALLLSLAQAFALAF